MPSGSLPFQSSQNFTGMLFDGIYDTPIDTHSPSLSTDQSFPSGTCVSGPTTPLDGPLLSPAHISYPTGSGGLVSVDSSAYTRLQSQNNLLERELWKERREHESLKYVLRIPHLFSTPADVHRLLFQKLLDSHNQLSAAVTMCTKRPHPDDSDLDAPTANTRAHREMLPPLSRSDFPLVKFWTREEWNAYNTARKDSTSAKVDKSRGAPTDYIEEADGTPVSSTTIAEIRHFARSIWIGAFQRGKAPKTWGDASKEL